MEEAPCEKVSSLVIFALGWLNASPWLFERFLIFHGSLALYLPLQASARGDLLFLICEIPMGGLEKNMHEMELAFPCICGSNACLSCKGRDVKGMREMELTKVPARA